jgi:hypothetical protein
MLHTDVSYSLVRLKVVCQYAEGELFAFVSPPNDLSIDVDDHLYDPFGFLVEGTAYLSPLSVLSFFVTICVVDLSRSNVEGD